MFPDILIYFNILLIKYSWIFILFILLFYYLNGKYRRLNNKQLLIKSYYLYNILIYFMFGLIGFNTTIQYLYLMLTM